jgi:hypothetical protein
MSGSTMAKTQLHTSAPLYGARTRAYELEPSRRMAEIELYALAEAATVWLQLYSYALADELDRSHREVQIDSPLLDRLNEVLLT